ncbi:MAG: phenylpropionate dioxygenase-like ring-hydroxylating dioxygenase large terminal subunit [Cellvibrionaceae bacterium]|jgi:phenylpropionate dioxygenase-like ring-hydroxylating dioxygenase large terminal subunit
MMGKLAQHTYQSSGRVRSLDASYYINEEALKQERYSLFFKTWQFACHAADLAEPGSYQTISIFDQNIILVRTLEGEVKAHFNVCPHRGHQLVEGCGEKRAFTCPYHAWTFGLDGELLGARGMKSAENVEKSDIGLFPVRVDQLHDLIFINLDPDAIPLNDYYPSLAEQIKEACPEVRDYVQYSRDGVKLKYPSEWNANWKVLIDNFLECYHCESAHPTFSDMLCIPDSIRNVYHHFTHEVTPLGRDPEKWPHPVNLEHDIAESHFWFLFPNTVIGRSAGVPNFYISRIEPNGPDKAIRTTIALRPPEWSDEDAPRRARLRSEWSVSTVGPEDQALCENVQRGMHQLGYQQGWYITTPDEHNISEHAIRYFHDLYLDMVSAD